MKNNTSTKSLRLLAHPLSLLAIGLMLANDLLFKPLWPSWWTGKLSDFAGLFFLPFLLAALASLVVPTRPRLSAVLGFGLTGLGFCLLKLDPGINTAILGAAHTLTGLSLQARPDPSDLLALLSLLPAAGLWRRVAAQGGMASQPFNRRLLLVVPLAALVTLGDAAAPALGVAYLKLPDSGSGPIQALTSQFSGQYQTQDGGLTWQALVTPIAADFSSYPGQMTAFTDPMDSTQYRFIPGQSIQRSTDGGETWSTEFSLTPLSEPEQIFVRLTHAGNIQLGSAPYAAMVDPATGNLILAMGFDGVLVRRRAGDWLWAAVGPYRHDSLRQAGMGGLLLLLQSQLTLAALVGLGWLYTRAARLLAAHTAAIWTILGWVGLGMVSLLVVPEVAVDSYLGIATFISLIFMAFACLLALLVALIRLKRSFLRLMLSALPQALLLAAACLLPYVLWGLQVLPSYGLALALSTALVLALMIVLLLQKEKLNI